MYNKNMKQYLKGIVKIKEDNKFDVIASTADVDRDGEIIDPKGWDLENFLKNPVILWAHQYHELPIGIAENTKIGKLPNSEMEGLLISGRFADEKANPKAEQVRRLYADGILKTVSVGFIPKERNGMTITKAELLELSFVPVPANPQALALAMAKGLDVSVIPKNICDPDSPDYDPDKCKETKPAICEPDNPEYNPQACGAIFCDPDKPTYNQEFCDLMKDGKIKYFQKQEGTFIQTIILSKKIFPTLTDAKKWAEDHDFRTDKVDETEANWRFRQEDVSKCEEGSLRTIELTDGVSAVICRPEKCVKCVETKAGRILSAKNRDLISGSISTMKQSIAVLDELLNATEPPEKGGNTPAGGQQKKRSEGNGGKLEISLETLKELRSHQREADRQNELSNAVLNRILKRQ
ncbi:MAG TPA: HK97 family phage prohead protease [Candidatus Brocadiaceae bacterium]|nr:HK97 family phage prohead protease [Candidatus Brocadiaceae bacterium]